MSEQAEFLQGNLSGHISVMSLTASVGPMAVFMVDFVDMIFTSMPGKAELAAAIGYAGAVLFFTTSFSIEMAIAGGALGARALVSGAGEEARHRATTAMLWGVAFGLAGGWLALRVMSRVEASAGTDRVAPDPFARQARLFSLWLLRK